MDQKLIEGELGDGVLKYKVELVGGNVHLDLLVDSSRGIDDIKQLIPGKADDFILDLLKLFLVK